MSVALAPSSHGRTPHAPNVSRKHRTAALLRHCTKNMPELLGAFNKSRLPLFRGIQVAEAVLSSQKDLGSFMSIMIKSTGDPDVVRAFSVAVQLIRMELAARRLAMG